MAITSFKGKYGFLSNFYPSRIGGVGLMAYPTAEHAYQSMKTTDPRERREIATAPTPGKAKRLGKRATLRKGWEGVKEDAMLRVLRAKFTQNPELGSLLLETWPQVLVEGNTWGDREWGVCDGEGENKLGRLLMQVRDELRGS